MNSHRNFFAAAVLIFTAGIFSAVAQGSNTVTTAPVFAPDYTHAGEPMQDGVLAWDETTKALDATNEQESAKFVFSFTNISTGTVVIMDAHGSCSCTTTELPQKPWILPAGTNGQIGATVDLRGKMGTLFKTVTVTTDHGRKDLILRINILPPSPARELSDAERAAGMAASKVDRQAVFKGECASCHVKKVDGKYGQQLFDALCAICHEAKNRATMVPDLANLQIPTSDEFWRTWITAGKAGSLMPAFAQSQHGPLNDLQIASLAAYLNAIHPSKVPPAK
jgi:mono/diheme cytochrome c family protein